MFFMFPIFAFWPLLIPLIIFFIVFRLGPRIFRGLFRDLERSQGRSRFDYYPRDLSGRQSHGYYGRDLESVVFSLAYRRKGRITVSDVIVETGLGMRDAEEFINGMVDGIRVRMEVDEDRGFVVYEFPEIIERFENE